MINISFTYNAKLTAGNRALYFFFLLGILLTAKTLHKGTQNICSNITQTSPTVT